MKNLSIWISVIFVLAITGCAKKENSSNQSAIEKSEIYIPEVTRVTTRTGIVPDFSWKDPAGKLINFDEFRGKVTLINFWATWCGPCKHELPALIALSEELSERNVVILGIATDRVTSDVAPFVSAHGIPYTVILSNEDLEKAFGNIRLVPTTFLINAEGKITDTIIGARTKDQFKEAILALLD